MKWSLKDMQIKLNEKNQVKDNLKITNEFTPNVSSLNQEDTTLFGSIRLNGYCSYMSLFKTQILTDKQQSGSWEFGGQLTAENNCPRTIL
jgi:hypothetical protein